MGTILNIKELYREKTIKGKRQKGAACLLLLLIIFILGGCGALPQTISADEGQDVSVQAEAVPDDDISLETEYECYAYDQLDPETRQVYDELVRAIETRAEKAELSTTSLEQMEKAYQAIRYDHCEYFWLSKFSYVTYSNRKDEIKKIEFTPEFSVDAEEQAKLQAQIDEEAGRLLSDAPYDGSDFDKVLYVYETLIDAVDYDKSAENNQNLISTFIGHRTVCQGYAYGAQYLLHQLGIPCTTVEGVTEDGNHSWNLVKMDGDYYYVDLTWGNSQYTYDLEDNENASSEKFVDYTFLGADSETILQTRTPSDVIPLPDCTAQEDNYYIHENLYFSEWDPDAVGETIRDAYEADRESVQIKFSDMELYEQAMQYFLEDYHIMDYCEGIKRVQYIENSDHNVLYLLFDKED